MNTKKPSIFAELRSARVIQLLSLAESLRKLLNTPLISKGMVDAGEVTLERSRLIVDHVEKAIEHLIEAIRILGQGGLQLSEELNRERIETALTTLGVPPDTLKE